MKNTSSLSAIPLCMALGAFALTSTTQAQPLPPDAGQILRELQPVPAAPREDKAITLPAPTGTVTPAGGPQVVVNAVSFRGNSALDAATLNAAVGDVVGQRLDLSGLRALADRVAAQYRASGYPFARAIVPAQDLVSGALVIEVVEGRYGTMKATGVDPQLTQAAQDYLSLGLEGALIERATLERVERATLLLSDLPGLTIDTVLRPGQDYGTGDLDVRITRTAPYSGDVGVDNQGDRYTGYYRAHANLNIQSPFLLGDQIKLNALYSDLGLWLGSASYSAPLGANGWRASAGYAHTYYLLGKDFAALDANGTADVFTAGVSYPLVRSAQANLTVGINWQHKSLTDIKGAAGTESHKSSDSQPVTLQFDHRDNVGGFTYGSLGFTPGLLNVSDEAADSSSGLNTRGHFNKWNLNLARIQSTPAPNLSLFGRMSAQSANKNLDSSERFSLGGPAGVRAYPLGEAIGDDGCLAQLELRYQVGAFSPYAFYDAGTVRINAKPGSLTPAPTTNTRSIAGAGVGTRYQQGSWNIDLAVAWRTAGGAPQADKSSQDPRVWLTAGRLF